MSDDANGVPTTFRFISGPTKFTFAFRGFYFVGNLPLNEAAWRYRLSSMRHNAAKHGLGRFRRSRVDHLSFALL